ncbi:MAG: [protein-PII] uridylyltransferase, partial [Halieaceae bacterium]
MKFLQPGTMKRFKAAKPPMIKGIPLSVFSPEEFAASVSNSDQAIPLYRQAITKCSALLDEQFINGVDIQELIHARATLIDHILATAWEQFDWGHQSVALVAVGGYGRGELHPHSDIDLLILVEEHCDAHTPCIEGLVALLWDINLNIGHSVRTVSECVDQALKDITVTTSLMESRLLAGTEALRLQMIDATGPDKIWASDDFFSAKRNEQIRRHRKFANSEYNLEPNIKSSPGGLRDAQMIGWFAKRHFDVPQLEDLIESGFLQAAELQTLRKARNWMWRVRYALHMLSGRAEERLVFDRQRELAGMFGYEDSNATLAVEAFMQQYYRWALQLSQLNEVLMQYFDEAILHAGDTTKALVLNERFQVRNGLIEIRSDDVFSQHPPALLEIFLLMTQQADINGVRASTIRSIRDHSYLIDDAFRADPKNRQTFIDLLRSTYKIALQLRRMNKYGILGLYLPEFGRIVGKMQHDLFHIYTVDAHTLEVVKNMRRFQYPDMRERFPIAGRIVGRLPKLELLYIAGLYHDIAKGRGGDHSTLGAADATQFCENHGISPRDTRLVCWLIEQHLLMSGVAQRQDISDPIVIQNFAMEVGDETRLDYLYAMTVADINATNPTLWNHWRASLMSQLYAETKRALRRGLENPVDRQELIEENQRQAVEQLEDRGFALEDLSDIWRDTGEDYFLRERPEDIVWHTESVAQAADSDKPLVLIKSHSDIQYEGATQIFIYTHPSDYLFSVITSTLEQLELSIHDARMYTSGNNMTIDTFFVLDANGEAIASDQHRIAHIRETLEIAL